MALRIVCEPAVVKSAIYAVMLATVVGFVGYLSCKQGVQTRYSIVFNCHSEYSNMHVYKLEWESGMWTLAGDYFESLAAGLRFYADKPPLAARSLRLMLVNATGKVPSSYHHITRLSLGATRSLLDLKDNRGYAILEAVRKLFYGKHISPFMNGTVDILDGADKAFYLWATISFLLNETMNTSNVAALDLETTTMQLAFLPTDGKPATDTEIPSLVGEYTMFDQKVHIYTRNYSSMGLESARTRILNRGGPGSQSPCLAPVLTFLEKYSPLITYETSTTDYSECYKDCKAIVEAYKLESAPGLDERDIYATSSYYQLAKQVGMIPKDAARGEINLTTIEKHARIACKVLIDKKDTLCVDLTYLYALLRDGFMLPPNKTIHVVKEINGQDVVWTLGMALSQLYE